MIAVTETRQLAATEPRIRCQGHQPGQGRCRKKARVCLTWQTDQMPAMAFTYCCSACAERITADVYVAMSGCIVQLTGMTLAGVDWLREFCDAEEWQWQGPTLNADRRFAEDIITAAREHGLKVTGA